jgi:hypothetical protein
VFDNPVRNLFVIGVLAICMIRGADALAVPDEIEVYTEDLNAPGEFGLEQHLNYVIKGTQTPDYPGQTPTQHVLQMTPEFSYGITKNLEAGFYLPFAVTPGGYTFLNALRVRLKYIAPRREDENLFYGLNVEISRDSTRTSDSISGLEIRPIIGYRDVRWLASFNPILNTGLAANVSHKLQFEPALKLTHTMGEDVRGGLEYYGAYGPLGQPLPSSQRAHTVYAVADVETREFDFNFGIGRGFVNAVDIWVMKAIIELPLK